MSQFRPTPKTTWPLLAGLLCFVFLSGFFQVSDCDVGYHLRTAAHILAGKGIPTTNTFSSATPEHPWLLHQWLGTIVFYLPFALGGVGALITFKAFVAVLMMLLVWFRARDLTAPGSLAPFWMVTVGTVAARVRFFERPDLLSALFFALLLYLDGRWNQNRRWQWIGLPFLMAFWANIHAGVIYGFLLLSVLSGAEWLELGIGFLSNQWESLSEGRCRSELKHLLIRPAGFVVSALAAFLAVQIINPNGWRVLWFPISQFSSKFWQGIILEYQPPSWAGNKAFYLFFAGVIVLQALTAKQINLRLLLISAVFGYLACSSQRSLLFFTVAAVPHAAYMLDYLWLRFRSPVPKEPHSASETIPAIRRMLRWTAGVLFGTWTLLAVMVFVPDRTFRFGTGWYHPYYPLEIYNFLAKEVPPQGVFNEMRYGGSMLWWLYPRLKPYIDGRGDAYSESFWLTEYLPVLEARPGWRDVLRAHDLHCVLLPISETGEPLPLVRTLLSDSQWALVSFNDHTVVFLERTETNRQLIARQEFKVLRPGDWTFAWVDRPDARGQGVAETERLLMTSPDSLFARTAQVRLFMSSARFSEAAAELRGILRDYPEAGQAYWRDYGYALCRIGQLDASDSVFSRMISKNQLSGFACFMRYHIALERRDIATARRFLARALEIEPDNPEYSLARTNLDQAILAK
jgi:hypothetical protein